MKQANGTTDFVLFCGRQETESVLQQKEKNILNFFS